MPYARVSFNGKGTIDIQYFNTMWQANIEKRNNGSVRKVSVHTLGSSLRFNETIELLRRNEKFRDFYNNLLASAPFDAFFWELPPITLATYQREFEFVLVDAPTLNEVPADNQAFAQYWTEDALAVVEFPNIGRDALLIAPCPIQQNLSCYSHLAAFCRAAPADQRDDFWRQVGETITRHLRERAMWISTSGLGVYWLHVRLDSYPKYYTYKPYKNVNMT